MTLEISILLIESPAIDLNRGDHAIGIHFLFDGRHIWTYFLLHKLSDILHPWLFLKLINLIKSDHDDLPCPRVISQKGSDQK